MFARHVRMRHSCQQVVSGTAGRLRSVGLTSLTRQYISLAFSWRSSLGAFYSETTAKCALRSSPPSCTGDVHCLKIQHTNRQPIGDTYTHRHKSKFDTHIDVTLLLPYRTAVQMVETCKLPNGYAGHGASLCFLNSVAQMLLAAPGGMARLETHAQQCGSADTCNTCRLSRCLYGCAAAAAGSADITDIVGHLQDFGFCHEAWQQEDAGEVLEALLQSMTPEVSNRFEVQTTIKTTCAFGHTIQRDDACKLFQVQVAGKVGLQDMVDGTLAEEQVDHRCDTCVLGVADVLDPVCMECNRIVHEYHKSSTCVKGDSGCMGLVHPCTDCIEAALRHSSAKHNCMRKPTESSQQTFVRKAPQHLVVHQKRFGYNKQQQAPYKLFDGCDVNRVLHMPDPYVRQRHRYQITGVVAHDGAETACAGHYVWLRFDEHTHSFVDVVSDDAIVVRQRYSDACKKYQPYLVLARGIYRATAFTC